MDLPDDIAERVRLDFGSQSEQAAKTLSEAAVAELIHPRVLRCIVYLSRGNTVTLSKMIEAAVADYRDVIFAAEYEDRDKRKPRRVRDFNKPFGKER